MIRILVAATAAATALACAPIANATMIVGRTVNFAISGAGISASGSLSYIPDTISGDPAGANLITVITGTFSDANVGLLNVSITGLIATSPNPDNAPFATSLSYLPVLDPDGLLPADDAGVLSYSNLFYPLGAPDTCFDGITGGYLDVFGMMLTLSNGDVVDIWSNGGAPNNGPIYGAALASDGTYTAIDYVAGGVSMSVPEPGTLVLLGTGLMLAAAAVGRRRSS